MRTHHALPRRGLRTLLLLALSFASAACGAGTESPVGVWTIDAAATLDANQQQIADQVERLPAERRTDGRAQLEELFAGLSGTIELKADGRLVSRTVFAGQPQEMSGSWEADGSTITTTAQVEGSPGPKVLSGTFDENRLTLAEGDAQVLVLRRD